MLQQKFTGRRGDQKLRCSKITLNETQRIGFFVQKLANKILFVKETKVGFLHSPLPTVFKRIFERVVLYWVNLPFSFSTLYFA